MTQKMYQPTKHFLTCYTLNTGASTIFLSTTLLDSSRFGYKIVPLCLPVQPL